MLSSSPTACLAITCSITASALASIAADGTLVVATAPDAMVPEALDDLALAYRRPIIAEESSRHEVERLIARLTSGGDATLTLSTALPTTTPSLPTCAMWRTRRRLRLRQLSRGRGRSREGERHPSRGDAVAHARAVSHRWRA